MKQIDKQPEPKNDFGTFPRRKLSRVRIHRTKTGKFVVDCIDREKRGRAKVFDLDRSENAMYRDWPTTGEVTAILERGPDMLRVYRLRGFLRFVRVYRGSPQRWHQRYHPDDVRELELRLRREEREKRQANAVSLTPRTSRT